MVSGYTGSALLYSIEPNAFSYTTCPFFETTTTQPGAACNSIARLQIESMRCSFAVLNPSDNADPSGRVPREKLMPNPAGIPLQTETGNRPLARNFPLIQSAATDCVIS